MITAWPIRRDLVSEQMIAQVAKSYTHQSGLGIQALWRAILADTTHLKDECMVLKSIKRVAVCIIEELVAT